MKNELELKVNASQNPEVEIKIKTNTNVILFYITFSIVSLLFNASAVHNFLTMNRSVDWWEILPHTLYAFVLALSIYTIIPAIVKYLPSNIEKDYQTSMNYHKHYRNSAYKEIQNLIKIYNEFTHKDNETSTLDSDVVSSIKKIITQCQERADLHQKKLEEIAIERDKLFGKKGFKIFRSNNLKL